MPNLLRFFVLVFVLLVVGASAFIVLRAVSGEQTGPPTAICPGPDGYGYVCADEFNVEYIDATNDAGLYDDDDLVLLELPFTFTFYGVEYDEVWASSNGNLQFTAANPAYNNECLVPQPAVDMGDMIAPYWDDLTLAFVGFLQTEEVGQAPERIFVVEWDEILKFGSVEDQLTFEVQLFEGSNDIVFLYQDAQTLEGPNGSQATIGLQSEQQGYALQVSCNQNSIYDGSIVYFSHPETHTETAFAAHQSEAETQTSFQVKGLGARLVETLNAGGRQGLTGLQLALLNERPRLESQWMWADLDGDGKQELVALWHGDVSRPQLVELAVTSLESDGRWQLSWREWPLARQERLRSLSLAAQGDVTGDGNQEIIMRDPLGGAMVALVRMADGFEIVELPGRCSGSFSLRDDNGDGAQEIIVGGCPGGQRWTYQWQGKAFSVQGNR